MNPVIYKGTLEDLVKRLEGKSLSSLPRDAIVEIMVNAEPPPPPKPTPTRVEPMPSPSRGKPSRIDKRLDLDPAATIDGAAGSGYTFTLPASPSWFKRKIQSIFKDNAVGRRIGNKLHGKLDFKRLYRISTTSKVFCREEDVSKKKYNILLLVDCSGSMSGTKLHTAITSAMNIIRDFQDFVSLEVAGFTNVYRAYKKFDTKIGVSKLVPEVAKKMVEQCNSTGGSNHDHIAIKTATKSLLKRTGQKILLVLSDGEPCCGGYSPECDDDFHSSEVEDVLRHNIRTAEAKGITVLSVGIISHAVEKYYKHSVVINKIEDLHKTLCNYMDRYIKRIPVLI